MVCFDWKSHYPILSTRRKEGRRQAIGYDSSGLEQTTQWLPRRS